MVLSMVYLLVASYPICTMVQQCPMVLSIMYRHTQCYIAIVLCPSHPTCTMVQQCPMVLSMVQLHAHCYNNGYTNKSILSYVYMYHSAAMSHGIVHHNNYNLHAQCGIAIVLCPSRPTCTMVQQCPMVLSIIYPACTVLYYYSHRIMSIPSYMYHGAAMSHGIVHHIPCMHSAILFLFIISLAIKQGHTEAYNIAYNNASYTKM